MSNTTYSTMTRSGIMIKKLFGRPSEFPDPTALLGIRITSLQMPNLEFGMITRWKEARAVAELSVAEYFDVTIIGPWQDALELEDKILNMAMYSQVIFLPFSIPFKLPQIKGALNRIKWLLKWLGTWIKEGRDISVAQ